MSRTYSHIIQYSQAYYTLVDGHKSLDKDAGKQVSYNIPRVMFNELKRAGVIIFVSDDEQGEDYYLNENVKLILSDNIIALIGEKYRNQNNKFFVRFAFSNSKAQLIKRAYSLKGQEYQWFVQLYNENVINSEMLYTYNKNDNTFVIDVNLPK